MFQFILVELHLQMRYNHLCLTQRQSGWQWRGNVGPATLTTGKSAWRSVRPKFFLRFLFRASSCLRARKTLSSRGGTWSKYEARHSDDPRCRLCNQARPRMELLMAPETDGTSHPLISSICTPMQDPGMNCQGRARCKNSPTFITDQFRRNSTGPVHPHGQWDLRQTECVAVLKACSS